MEEMQKIKELLGEIESVLQPGTPKGDSAPGLINAFLGLKQEILDVEKEINRK